ncbi:MAG: serine/threonine protein kinase [Deltaproteobacteria bacterium]|nr:serine/threonine protein kinase [Deltaproteobacteria bacterium]
MTTPPSRHRLWSRLAAPSDSPSLIADARALLQRRVAFYFQVQAVLSGAAYLLYVARATLDPKLGIGALFAADPGQVIGHGAFVVLFAVAWHHCGQRLRSAGRLHLLEGTGTVLICWAFGLVLVAPPVAAAVARGSSQLWQMFLLVAVTLVVRAALVPSRTSRTIVVGVVSMLPLLLAVQRALTTYVGRPLWSAPGETVWMVAGWAMSFVAVSAVISRTIYGLQARVRDVMQLGQYTLLEKLGEGGMGTVYRARHAMMRRPTAVKLLPPERAGEASVARFEREVQLTAELTHPNTITIYDYGRTPDGVFYYAMELLDGADLEDVVEASGPQSAGRVLRVLTMVAGALAEAHEVGLIHRDIKPANIILCRQGGELDVAKVLDFGLVKSVGEPQDARLTQEGMVTGTPLYLAPEALVSPDEVDARSDLYSLGAVAYFLVTGQDVFEGDSVLEICSHHLRSEPEPPSARLGRAVPADLEALILECLRKQPEQRPQSARELLRRLESCQGCGGWGREQARAWWDEHGAALGRASGAPRPTELAETIAVDLVGRAG